VALAGILGGYARTPSLRPFDLTGPLVGCLAGVAILSIERLLRTLPLRNLMGGFGGLVAGGLAADLVLRIFTPESLDGMPPLVLRGFVLLLFGYAGAALGATHAGRFSLRGLRNAWSESAGSGNHLIVDTSAIIDGRIADVLETGFIDGTFVVPQFVLRELQYIADSQDALKRNRGRKGLEILQRMKKGAGNRVMVSDADFPGAREVDMKLIELARQMGGRIVTNDFNLNKVAELRGVRVLNINVLANALRPVVLPGESMGIFVLKEGKEPNQGVGYLDDGTMVVVDNAKRFIGKSIDITVTSVLQTTAGKMFFGRCESGEESAIEVRPRRTGA
jgi:uncharacterized protein YacL